MLDLYSWVDDAIPDIYTFQGRSEEEQVPDSVIKLIINPGVRILPNSLCNGFEHLREATLPCGLQKIGDNSFYYCNNLLEINQVPNTVKAIGAKAFQSCIRLKKVVFEDEANSPHQLTTIGDDAFSSCESLPRIKPPSSLASLGERAFFGCSVLTEADLSKTCVTEISECVFAFCDSLQTASLPNTLERICREAFLECFHLVTVVMSLESLPIRIEDNGFNCCESLANLVLPTGSTAHEHAFRYCTNLESRFQTESADEIVACLIRRFGNFPVNKLCYYLRSITPQELRQCIDKQDEEMENRIADEFGMTPFHILFSSTAEPSMEMLEVLLENYPYQLHNWKDSNDKRPLDYLINNWTVGTVGLLHRTLQSWIIDPVACWGPTSWTENMQSKVQGILSVHDKERRTALLNEAYSAFGKYEKTTSTSILELALWKGNLKSGRSNDGTKRRTPDRKDCLCKCGSDIVIPNVAAFLWE